MISNVLSNAIASIRHQAVDGDLLPCAAAADAAPQAAGHPRFEPAFDGAVDLPELPPRTAFDRLAQTSQMTLQSPTWLRENLAPMEVAVKQLLRDIASVQKREGRATDSQKETQEQAGGRLKRAADAMADMRAVMLPA